MLPGRGLVLTQDLIITCALALQAIYVWNAGAQTTARFKPPIVLESPRPLADGVFGQMVTWVPDVNGDGKADILVGAPEERTDGFLGRIYIFDGATQALLREITPPPGAIGYGLGVTLAGMEDVNGDGRGDVVAGTGGTAWVFDGVTSTVIYTISNVAGLAPVPDVNGDGRPDLFVGNIYSSPPTFRLINGDTGQLLTPISDPSRAGSGDFNGKSLFGLASGIPDVNGDGRGDLIVGAQGEDLPATPEHPTAVIDAGRAYVFDGATGALLYALSSPDERTTGHFGNSVIGLPDLNGDGRGDFAITQAAVGGPPGVSGRVYVYDGASGNLMRSTELIPPTNGTTGNDFGFLTTVPDTTGDGIADFMVEGDNNGNPQFHFFNGATSALITTFPGYDDNGFRPESGLPDVNGDGLGEVLIGGYYANANKVYLYLSDGPRPPPDPVAVGQVEEGFVVLLRGEPDTAYELQVSEDLFHWATVLKETLTSPEKEFLDTEAKNKSLRFYRTRSAQ